MNLAYFQKCPQSLPSCVGSSLSSFLIQIRELKENSAEGRENWQLPCLVIPQRLLHLRNLYDRGWKVKLFFSCQIICFYFNFFFSLMKSRLSTILYPVRPCFILNCLQYWRDMVCTCEDTERLEAELMWTKVWVNALEITLSYYKKCYVRAELDAGEISMLKSRSSGCLRVRS